MKDIQLKKVAPSNFSTAASQPTPVLPAAKPSKTAAVVEGVITLSGKAAGALYSALVAPKQEPSTALVVVENKPKKRELVVKAAKTVGEKTKTKAKAAAKTAKTPVGKLAIVQAMAILALFAYVGAKTRTTGAVSIDAPTQQIGGSQRYLPLAEQYVEPKAFHPETGSETGQGLPLYTWVTPWNLDAVQTAQSSYSSLSAFWLTVNQDGVSFTPKASWDGWDKLAGTVTKKDGEKYYLTVSGDPDNTYLALSNPQLQTQHIAELLKIVKEHHFDGVDIDYEGLGSQNKALFTDFTRNLTTAFHAENKQVAVTVEARLANQVPMDWRSLGSIADELRVMVYDYHSQNTAEPGPITPIGWLKEVLDYTREQVDPSKVVIGLGNYGYDWMQTKDEATGVVSWKGAGISFEQAMAQAKDNNIPVVRVTGIDNRGYDRGSIPTYTYTDAENNQHAVWFEDNASLQAKLTLTAQYPVRGIIFWSVGLGDRAFWDAAGTVSGT